jgi:hypothetical protein
MKRLVGVLGIVVLSAWGSWAQPELDERLIGIWEQDESEVLDVGIEGRLRVELFADGTVGLGFKGIFNLAEINAEGGDEGDEDEDGDLDLIGLSSILSDDIEVEVNGSGTWEADGEVADLVLDEAEILFSGQDAETFFTEVGREVAQLLALALAIPDEGREVFEDEFVASFVEGLDDETLTGDFVGDGLGGPYRLEGETLILIDEEDGTETVLRRSNISAVQPLSWGQIKASR